MYSMKRVVIQSAAFCVAAFFVLAAAGCGSKEGLAENQVWGRADAKEIDVNSKVSGRVIHLYVKEGDQVKKGELIAVVDRRSLEAQRAQQEAAISSIKAQQEQARYQTTLARGTTAAQLDKASTELTLSKKDYERYQQLLQDGAVSKQAFDNYKTKYEAAEAAYQYALSSMQQNEVNEANEEALAKKLEQARAARDEVLVNLDETDIRAPFDGIITEKYIEEGSMLSLGTPLVAVQDPTDNWVDIKVPETELSRYGLYEKVDLIARDGVTKVTGTITDISKKSDFATRRATSERGKDSDIITFNMKVQVNSDLLRPGMRFRLAGEKE